MFSFSSKSPLPVQGVSAPQGASLKDEVPAIGNAGKWANKSAMGRELRANGPCASPNGQGPSEESTSAMMQSFTKVLSTATLHNQQKMHKGEPTSTQACAALIVKATTISNELSPQTLLASLYPQHHDNILGSLFKLLGPQPKHFGLTSLALTSRRRPARCRRPCRCCRRSRPHRARAGSE